MTEASFGGGLEKPVLQRFAHLKYKCLFVNTAQATLVGVQFFFTCIEL